MSPVIEQFAQAVRDATAQKKPLRLRGGGSKDFYGQSLAGEIFDTRGYAGIVDYDPSELVVTARCGTPLAELEVALAAKEQMLAFEPPHYGPATLGGAVAAGLSGPRRQAAGSLRDFVLGAKLMDGQGEVLTFGGQVMKNVAGYDVSRLLAGSLGTLGLILEVSLKTLPRPVAEATLSFEYPEDKAIGMLNQWAGRPLPISASAWTGGELGIRLSGAAAAVRTACQKLGGERVDDEQAARFWTGIREQRDPFFQEPDRNPAPLWRLSLPSSTPALRLPGEQMIEWGGSLRWFRTKADARTLREAAAKAGGHATLFRSVDKSAGAFQPLAPALAAIHAKLKAAFDPAGIFNPGRMYADL